MVSKALFTPRYLDEQRRLHAKGGYGVSSQKHADLILKIAVRYGSRSILDYGAGTGMLKQALAPFGIPIVEYDPAIPGKDKLPPKCDMVVCTDVLEHIEPDCIDAVLTHIRAVTGKCLFAIVATRLSENKFLSDGRNAHVLIQHGGWWQMKLEGVGFQVVDYLSKIEDDPLDWSSEWRALCEVM